MAHIYFNIDDYLHEASDEDLIRECKNRVGANFHAIEKPDYNIQDLLNQSADILRKNGDNSIAVRLEDLRERILHSVDHQG